MDDADDGAISLDTDPSGMKSVLNAGNIPIVGERADNNMNEYDDSGMPTNRSNRAIDKKSKAVKELAAQMSAAREQNEQEFTAKSKKPILKKQNKAKSTAISL